MMTPLTLNAQATLLLTAPLIVGRGDLASELLTLTEYNRLARLLREAQRQPADLTREWLARLVQEGSVEKLASSKPPRYRAVLPTDRLL